MIDIGPDVITLPSAAVSALNTPSFHVTASRLASAGSPLAP
jgi:hypothetical protein